jgi:RNA polymerase sigma-70 factor (ECF subfamily)
MEKIVEVVAPRWPEETSERAGLVRLCAHLTGDPAAAEDLAQETLIRAWSKQHQLRAPERREAWLKAIARNLCRRWRHDRAASPTHLVLPGSDDFESAERVGEPAADFDLEVELEREELARLLDRALASLPAETRRVLIERYVEESPRAETALRLGLSEGTVAMRLQRGKLALRQVLATELRDEAAAYGLVAEDHESWQETRIWCTFCGQRRAVGRFSSTREIFQLRCPGCGVVSDSRQSPRTNFRWDDVKGFRASLGRVVEWHRRYHLPGLVERKAVCPGCARPYPLRIEPVPNSAFPRFVVSTRCPCGAIAWESYEWLVLCRPEAQRFQRAHSRIQFAGARSIETGGRPALVTSYRSVTDGARLDVVSAADDLEILAVYDGSASNAELSEGGERGGGAGWSLAGVLGSSGLTARSRDAGAEAHGTGSATEDGSDLVRASSGNALTLTSPTQRERESKRGFSPSSLLLAVRPELSSIASDPPFPRRPGAPRDQAESRAPWCAGRPRSPEARDPALDPDGVMAR